MERRTFKPLVGNSNYHTWKEEAEALLGLDNCLGIVEGTETEPIRLIQPTSSETHTPTEKDMTQYEIRLEKCEDRIRDWKERNQKAYSRIILSCGEGPRTHIKAIKNAREMWDKLKMYDTPNETKRDLALQRMITSKQPDFETF